MLISRDHPLLRNRGVTLGLAWAVWAVVAAWLVYLLLQTGHPWDESEHAHVAWLISQGKRPLTDFFQHHQPLLWSLLTPYYRLGFQGAGVLLWGRVLVVCCALIAVFSLRRLGHWLGIALFIFLTLEIPELFVVRPETLSAALILAALAIWFGPSTSNVLCALAGMAAGAAVYASPRFAVMGGFFILLGRQTATRWACLCAGAALFVALYTVLADYPLSQVVFNTEFSAHLQTIGDHEAGWTLYLWVQVLLCTCGPLVMLVAAVARQHRGRAALLVAYALVVFLMCAQLAGRFRYPQAWAPFVVSGPIVAAWIVRRIEWPPKTVGFVGLGAAIVLAVMGLANLPPLSVQMQPLDLLTWIKARNELAASLPPREAVLLSTMRSPITAPDISYYGSPLWDGRDRLCTAVRTFNTTQPLPPCDFFAELEKHPYLTEPEIWRAVPLNKFKDVTSLLQSDYHPKLMDLRLFIVDVRRPRVPGTVAPVH